jgi:hypothetical protein
MAKDFRSNVKVTDAPVSPSFITHSLFDRSYTPFKGSPVDEFSERIRSVNMLSPTPNQFDPYMGQLLLLGTVAAVESYLRSIFRRVISLDDVCRDKAMKRDVSYAAALHLSPDLLPEALLERISFTSLDNIDKAFRELLGMKGEFPHDLHSVIADYVRVCHLRHCAVHRFGKLGASNAVHLGLDLHSTLLEKPLLLDYAALQAGIAICTAFVRVINGFIFNLLLSRLPDGFFSGDYSADRKKFLSYYDLFADKATLSRSPAPKDTYLAFLKERTAFAVNKFRS